MSRVLPWGDEELHEDVQDLQRKAVQGNDGHRHADMWKQLPVGKLQRNMQQPMHGQQRLWGMRLKQRLQAGGNLQKRGMRGRMPGHAARA